MHKYTPESFLSRTRREGECLVWTGPRNANGYGSTSYQGKRILVHRVAYVFVFGELPVDTEIDHICRNRACIEPDHLRAVSHQFNVARRLPALTCKRGHVYTAETTGKTKTGMRRCLL